MALIKPTLEKQLNSAFSKAMKKFIEVVKGGGAKDISDKAISEAAKTFAADASTAIDTYIKSATIIVPAGQIVAGGSAGGPVTGATTTPSGPAIIS
jgi:hypothetical protein